MPPLCYTFDMGRDADVPKFLTYDEYARRDAAQAAPGLQGPPGSVPETDKEVPSLWSRYYQHMARLTAKVREADEVLLRLMAGGPKITSDVQMRAYERFANEVYGPPAQRHLIHDDTGAPPERLIVPEAMTEEDAILFGKFLARGGTKQYETLEGDAQLVDDSATTNRQD